jgi:hypothetical protein
MELVRTEGTKAICSHCGEEHAAIETEECFNGFRALGDTHTHKTDEDSAACDAYHATMREQMAAGEDADYDAAQKLAREAADAAHDTATEASEGWTRLEEIAYDVNILGDGSQMDGKNNLETIIIQTLARLSVEVYDALNVSRILFVGPGPGQFGQALRLSLVGLANEPGDDDDEPKSVFAGTTTIRSVRIERDLIVLSNELCGQPIEDAMFTVAHELAHLYLGHVEHGRRNTVALPGKVTPEEMYETVSRAAAPAEADADRLAVSWGFELPEWRRRRAALS